MLITFIKSLLVKDFGVIEDTLSCLYLDFVITGKRDDTF